MGTATLAVGSAARVGAVWLTPTDGTPVPGAFGGDLAAPVLFDLFDALPGVALCHRRRRQTLVLPNSALPLPLRRFARRRVSAVAASPPPPTRCA